MNGARARELRGALARRYQAREVEVTPEDGGARITVTAGADSALFIVGDGPSLLLGLLLTGYPG